MRDSFVLYTEYRAQVEMLTMEQRGKLLTAIFDHASGQSVEADDDVVAMAFAFIRARMDRDAEKYEATCKARREAGMKGGRPQKPNGLDGKAKKPIGFPKNQSKAKKPDNDNDHDNDHEKIKDIYPYGEVVDYLNDRASTSFRSSSRTTRTHIKARFDEGYTLDDFKTVIDKKVKEWKGTDMAKYIRPETLFGSKFEAYLNQQDGKPRTTNRFNNFTPSTTDWDAVTAKIMEGQA